MQRLKAVIANSERGATAVIVGILLVALLGFGAIAVDVGALWWDRKQLQNGADAGALAIAQSCAANPAHAECKLGANAAAVEFAQGNKLDGNASGKVVALTSNSVTVETSSTRQLWLARVLGFDSAPVAAQATASWGAVGGGNTIPITIAKCAFDPAKLDQATGWVHLVTKSSDEKEDKPKDKKPSASPSPTPTETTPPPTVEDPCASTNPPHVLPGGFHWLMPDSGCEVSTTVDDWASTSTGNTNPNTCDEDKLNTLLQSGSVFIPMFDKATGTGSNAKYHLVGYAHFKPTNYCLTNKVLWKVDETTVTDDKGHQLKCTGSYRWIEGYFIKAVSLDAVLDPTAPDFGTRTVKLTG